eukprot:6670470-Alexandrium_andersonii.AAC.1
MQVVSGPACSSTSTGATPPRVPSDQRDCSGSHAFFEETAEGEASMPPLASKRLKPKCQGCRVSGGHRSGGLSLRDPGAIAEWPQSAAK